MDRREFLQHAALAGMVVVSPTVARGQSMPAATPYTGPFWIFINASGGWDPTDFCDPKGGGPTAADRVNSYATSDIGTAGNISFAPHAPVPLTQGKMAGMMPTNQMALSDFFTKYSSQMMVIRGIDLSTNGHSEGLRHSFSGKLGDGNPSLAALIAATYSPKSPMSFMTGGGYDATFGTVGATRIGNPGVLQSIAFPNVIDPTGKLAMGQTRSEFHSESIVARIEQVRAARYAALKSGNRLARIQNSISALFTAGEDQQTLQKVSQYLPDPLSTDTFESQVQIAIAAYKAGATISMSIGFGSFDTHGNHDAQHIPQMMQLAHNVDFLWTEAARQGIDKQTVMVMTSEMGRTPHYNAGNGKDHWSITSAVLMGQGIPGNKVIGATSATVAAQTIDPGTLATLDAKDPKGITLTPDLLHDALRKKAGVSDDLRRTFPISPIPQGGVDLFKA